MSSALSLTNTLASTSALLTSPSACDGVSAELEHDLRVWGCELVQRMGLHLRLPQVAVGTGQVLFQRFFYRRSMLKFGVEVNVHASTHTHTHTKEKHQHGPLKNILGCGHGIALPRGQDRRVPAAIPRHHQHDTLPPMGTPASRYTTKQVRAARLCGHGKVAVAFCCCSWFMPSFRRNTTK